jgi:hypothetical protein
MHNSSYQIQSNWNTHNVTDLPYPKENNNNIKMNNKIVCEYVDWFYLALEMVPWWALMKEPSDLYWILEIPNFSTNRTINIFKSSRTASLLEAFNHQHNSLL